MKKTFTLLSIAILFNCFCFTQLSAVVLLKTDTVSLAPPQYSIKKMAWIERQVIKTWGHRFTQNDKTFDVDKTSHQVLHFSLFTLLSSLGAIVGFLFAIVSSEILGIALIALFLPLTLIFGVASIVKAIKVIKNDTASKRQKNRARVGLVLSIVIFLALIFIPISIFYIDPWS